MNKLEYSDLHKFIVSVGIGLLGVSVAVPWLFLREPFDLLISTEQIADLTPTSVSILTRRQDMVRFYISALPWVSAFTALAGLGLIGWGALRWRAQQTLRDSAEALNLTKLQHEIEALSPKEIEAKSEAEGLEVDDPIPGETAEPEGVPSPGGKAYRTVERAVIDLCSTCLSDQYTPLENQRIGSALYDLILQSRTAGTRDLVLEIKYARKGFGANWMKDNLGKLQLALQIYWDRVRREADGCLLVVAPRELLRRTPTGRYTKRLEGSLSSFGRKAHLVFLAEEEIAGFSCREISRLIVAKNRGDGREHNDD